MECMLEFSILNLFLTSSFTYILVISIVRCELIFTADFMKTVIKKSAIHVTAVGDKCINPYSNSIKIVEFTDLLSKY